MYVSKKKQWIMPRLLHSELREINSHPVSVFKKIIFVLKKHLTNLINELKTNRTLDLFLGKKIM